MRAFAKTAGRHGTGAKAKVIAGFEVGAVGEVDFPIRVLGPKAAKDEELAIGMKLLKRRRRYAGLGAKSKDPKPLSETMAVRLRRAKTLAEAAKAAASADTESVPRAARLGTSAFATGARGLALLRGRAQMEALLTQSGGTFSQDQVIEMLYGISRQAIDKRVREGSLLAVPGPNGARRYPVCQFLADGSLIKGLKEVQAALPVRGPWSAFLFLMQPHDGLNGQKPLDALRAGDLARVLAAAEGLGVQGS